MRPSVNAPRKKLIDADAVGHCVARPAVSHIDPTAAEVDKAVITHGHSALTRGRAMARRAGHAGDARPYAVALWRQFRRLHAGGKARARHSLLGGAKVTFHPALAMCSGSRAGRGRVQGTDDQPPPATTKTPPIRPARRSNSVPCDVFISQKRRSAFRCSAIATPMGEIAKLLHSVAWCFSRARALGRRLFARQGAARHGLDPERPATSAADLSAWRDGEDHNVLPAARHLILASFGSVRGADKVEARRCHREICPPSSLQDVWTRRFPDPVPCFASGWMRVRARARQRGVELPLVISDHADWDGLTATITATGASEILGDARPGGRAGPLEQSARVEGGRPVAGHRRLRRRGRKRRHDRMANRRGKPGETP